MSPLPALRHGAAARAAAVAPGAVAVPAARGPPRAVADIRLTCR